MKLFLPDDVASMVCMSDAAIYALAAWVGIVGGIVTSSVAMLAFMKWGLKAWRGWLDDEVRSSLSRIEDQLSPNGGNTRSLGDTVMRMERTLRKLAGEDPDPPLKAT